MIVKDPWMRGQPQGKSLSIKEIRSLSRKDRTQPRPGVLLKEKKRASLSDDLSETQGYISRSTMCMQRTACNNPSV